MALPIYTVRTEAVDSGFICWIDMNNNPVIRQPNKEGSVEGTFFATADEAKAWGDNHAAGLDAANKAAEEAGRIKTEREEAAHQANLAMVAILERLTNPTA
jgi:hypothetical protein